MASAATLELVDISAHSNIPRHMLVEGSGKFGNAVVAPNGKIVFAPWNARAVGVFDINDKSFEFVNISAHINIDIEEAFIAGVVAPNGKIVMAPCNAHAVGVFDATDKTFELVKLPANMATVSYKFSEGVVAPNGKIVFPPYGANAIGVLSGFTGMQLGASGCHSQHSRVLSLGTFFAAFSTFGGL